MKIHIIAAALPPLLDGIGDYTACLATEMAHSAEVTVLTGATQPTPIPGVRVETAFAADDPASVRGIAKFVEADKPDWVLLQYNPFSYGRWGLNLHLPLVLRSLKRRCPGTRIAVMAHETFVPFGVNWKFRVMSAWQRPQFALLCRSADVLFFSIEAWANTFRAKFPGKPVVHLPVGSNMPYAGMPRAEARARLGIPDGTLVIGLFGSMHISRMMDWVQSAVGAVCATGQDVLVLYIGPHSAAVREALGSVPLIAEGPLDGMEVSRRFAAMDLHLTPFVDGVSTRRGSFLCGLQHGIATVGTLGHHTDTLLRQENGKALLLAEVAAPEQFLAHTRRLAEAPELRERLGQAGQRLFEREFAWASLAKRLLSALEQMSK